MTKVDAFINHQHTPPGLKLILMEMTDPEVVCSRIPIAFGEAPAFLVLSRTDGIGHLRQLLVNSIETLEAKSLG
jgi:hypothetical protein